MTKTTQPKTEPPHQGAQVASEPTTATTEPSPASEAKTEEAPAPAPAKGKAKAGKGYGKAAELLLKKLQRDAQKKREEFARDAEENIHFLKCPRIADHHAAYLTGPYEGEIRPDQWFSLLKAQDSAVWTRDHIPCQECYMEGNARPWAVHLMPKRQEDGTFSFRVHVKREYVLGSCSREEFEERSKAINESIGEKVI